jgi:hypothetical protein
VTWADFFCAKAGECAKRYGGERRVRASADPTFGDRARIRIIAKRKGGMEGQIIVLMPL